MRIFPFSRKKDTLSFLLLTSSVCGLRRRDPEEARMERRLLSDVEMARILERLACEVMEKHGDCRNLLFVGIERRGADLARRLQKQLSSRLGRELPLGTLDINLYRDDWTSMESSPHVGTSHMTWPVAGASIVLVDDVLYTGRTIRSALEAILDYGRPSRVELLVLVDRGGRELPIQADFVGRTFPAAESEHVDVLLSERDGRDEVLISGH